MTEWTTERIAELLEPLTGYTPGPWRAHDFCDEISVAPDDLNLDATAVCTGLATGPERPRGETWANARLIAAAPDLADALRAVAAELDKAVRDLAEVRNETIRQNRATDADYAKRIDKMKAERDAALAHAEKAEARSEALWNALDRLRPVPERLLRGVPVRDLSEALGEADAALAQGPSA